MPKTWNKPCLLRYKVSKWPNLLTKQHEPIQNRKHSQYELQFCCIIHFVRSFSTPNLESPVPRLYGNALANETFFHANTICIASSLLPVLNQIFIPYQKEEQFHWVRCVNFYHRKGKANLLKCSKGEVPLNIGRHNCGAEHIRFVCLQRSANCKKVSRNSSLSFITAANLCVPVLVPGISEEAKII